MSDCRFGVSPVNYPDPDPERKCLNVFLMFTTHKNDITPSNVKKT